MESYKKRGLLAAAPVREAPVEVLPFISAGRRTGARQRLCTRGGDLGSPVYG
jgi:hypothetical protein